MSRQSRKNSKLIQSILVIVLIAAAALLMQRLDLRNGAVNSAAQSTAATATVPASGITVTIIDVGQADSILLRSQNHAILIDAGEYDAAANIEAALNAANVKKLDAVILTHPHYDHFGGMRKILEDYEVGQYVTSEIPDDQIPTIASYEKLLDTLEKKGIDCRYAKAGMAFDLDGSTLTVLGPVAGKGYDNLNDYSVVTRLTCGNTAFLFMGDAQKASEKDIMATGATLSADVLKVGHHGSKTSSGVDFLAAVNPKIALISAGLDNSYGLPHNITLEHLKAINAAIYRTDLQGTIAVTSDGSTVSVHTEK